MRLEALVAEQKATISSQSSQLAASAANLDRARLDAVCAAESQARCLILMSPTPSINRPEPSSQIQTQQDSASENVQEQLGGQEQERVFMKSSESNIEVLGARGVIATVPCPRCSDAEERVTAAELNRAEAAADAEHAIAATAVLEKRLAEVEEVHAEELRLALAVPASCGAVNTTAISRAASLQQQLDLQQG